MPKTKTQFVPVTFRSLLQRYNRYLKPKNQEVKAVRLKGATDRTEFGEYFMLDTKRGEVIATQLTALKIAKLARDVGVLKPWEVMR
jgi:hypothetical protein